MNSAWIGATAEFVQMPIKALDFSKEVCIKGVLIENADGVVRIHGRNDPVACIYDGPHVLGGNVTTHPDDSKVSWHTPVITEPWLVKINPRRIHQTQPSQYSIDEGPI